MKRVVSLFLVLVLCLSLSACKSKDVKFVEEQISLLSKGSNYADINYVYKLYRALPLKDQEKVENIDALAEYCDPQNGNLVLSEEMLAEIESEFEMQSYGATGAKFSVIYDLAVTKAVEGWSDYGDINIASHKKVDAYTYCVYGNFKAVDKYGKTMTKEFTMSYRAEYNKEEPGLYEITHDTKVQ